MKNDKYEFEEPPHVMIVEASRHPDIVKNMSAGVLSVLDQAGASYERYTVPGLWEIPQAIKYAVRGLDFYTARRRYDAYIGLGCLIGAQDSHKAQAALVSSEELLRLSIDHTLSVGNGIFTCTSQEEALKCAGDDDDENIGLQAAYAALDMLVIKSHFGIYPRT